MVLALKGPNLAAVRAGQQFLGKGAWEDAPILARHQRLVAEELDEPDGVIIFEGATRVLKGQKLFLMASIS